MFALLGLPIDVAYHLVSALAGAFAPLLGGLAVAAAIVLFTIMVRLLVLPLSYYAFRGQRAQARIAPQIQDLYKRHSGQPERLQRELSALRAREGAGMFTGCLPALLQIPFFTVVYRLFLSGTVDGRPNLLLHQHLFSASLGSHWLAGAGPWSGQGLVFAAVFALLALVAWLAARAARRWAAPPAQPPGAPGRQPGAAARQPGAVARPQSAPVQQQGAAGFLMRILPFATVAFAALVPLAAGLYLLTTTAWAAAERAVFSRLAPAPPAPTTSKPQRSPKRSAGRPGPGV
ncbi:MAG TPA: membrane protein insertase YidC [Streptosporangiaceae bacterium]|nr:membrane protein insertase YidC [Streptosporangiaceae bacterium]